VHETCWTGSGPEFTLNWGGHRSTLVLDEPNPGLFGECGRANFKLLSLEGLAKAGRFEAGTFSGRTLIGFERHRESVRATFAPPEWGGLVVRAEWASAPDREQVDLEVQVSAASVGELSGVEVVILSRYWDQGQERLPSSATRAPIRDQRPAAAGADGGKSCSFPHDSTNLPFTDPRLHSLPPRVWAPPGIDAGVFYIEMAHPNDVSRRILEGEVPTASTSAHRESTRYALFGHDLEKGVVLRGRVRGRWVRSETPGHDALFLYEEFLREPLSLRT
jgi:hypothetical protein